MQKIIVSSDVKGIEIAKDKIYEVVDGKTVLFLSGGKTPEPLYKIFVKERVLKPGAVAIVDERFAKLKIKSEKLKVDEKILNEKMMKDSGLLDYLKAKRIPFYGILEDKPLEETARDYDNMVKSLFKKFSKRIAVLGIGEDGHIASLPAGKSENSNLKSQKFATDINYFPGEFRERISLTFQALSQMDLIIVLVFGSAKQNALDLMFSEGTIEEIPARFLNTSKVSHKTLLITDQKL